METPIEELITKLSELFDEGCQEARNEEVTQGQAFAFLENDVLEQMCVALVQVANDARYHFIKLLLLQEGVEQQLKETELGAKAFKGTGEEWKDGGAKRDEWRK